MKLEELKLQFERFNLEIIEMEKTVCTKYRPQRGGRLYPEKKQTYVISLKHREFKTGKDSIDIQSTEITPAERPWDFCYSAPCLKPWLTSKESQSCYIRDNGYFCSNAGLEKAAVEAYLKYKFNKILNKIFEGYYLEISCRVREWRKNPEDNDPDKNVYCSIISDCYKLFEHIDIVWNVALYGSYEELEAILRERLRRIVTDMAEKI